MHERLRDEFEDRLDKYRVDLQVSTSALRDDPVIPLNKRIPDIVGICIAVCIPIIIWCIMVLVFYNLI